MFFCILHFSPADCKTELHWLKITTNKATNRTRTFNLCSTKIEYHKSELIIPPTARLRQKTKDTKK